jgi:hypothetical protein
MTTFNSIENLNLILNIFKEYMLDKFKIQISEKEQVYMKQHIYKLMQLVPDQMRNKTGNIQVLNAAKDYYMQQRSSMKPTTEIAENKEDFLKKLKDFEMRRNGMVPPPTAALAPPTAAALAPPTAVYLPVLKDDDVHPFIIIKEYGAFIFEKIIPFTAYRNYVVMKPIEATCNYPHLYMDPPVYKIISIDNDVIILDRSFEKNDFSIGDHLVIGGAKYIVNALHDKALRITSDATDSLLNQDVLNLHTRPIFIFP